MPEIANIEKVAQVRFFEDPEFLRKQTFFLLGAMVCALMMLFSPLYTLQSALGGVNLSKAFNVTGIVNARQIEGITDNLNSTNMWTNISYLLTLILAGGCLASLFLYKKRKQQASIGRALALIFLLVPGSSYMASKEFAASVTGLNLTVSYGWGLVFSLAGMGMTFYAAHLIIQDEKKIKAASRLW